MSRLQSFMNRFIYRNDTELINNTYKKSQNFFIIQAIFATAFTVLTGGVVLSGFTISIGASDQTVGFISLFPNIVGILLIFSSFILERFKRRKKLVICMTILGKAMVCSVLLVPLVVPENMRVMAIAGLLLLSFSLLALNGVAVNVWFISVVPNNIRGRYFGLRQMFALVISLILPGIVGIVLDITSGKYMGFSILFCVGLFMAVGESITYTRIEEPEVKNIGAGNIKLSDVIKIPIHNADFMRYVGKVGFFYLVVFLSATFTQVYMIRYLELSFTFINIASMCSAALQMLCYRIWGKISDINGHSFVMRISIWFIIVEFGLWALMPQSLVHFILPIAYIFAAVGNSGYALSVFNTRYSVMPEKGRSLYEGFFGASLGIVFLISPILGGYTKRILEGSQWVMNMIPFGQFRLLYVLSTVGMLLLVVYEV